MRTAARFLALPTLTLVLVGSTVALSAPGASAARAVDVDVVAHRGSSGAAPENTIAAVRVAIAQKSGVIENDIQRTSDGELVIVHDITLARTTDVEQVFPDRAPWNVGDFTLAEVKQLDAGSWFAPEFAGERVPTLEEWVNAVGQQAEMLLEPKAPELYPGIETDLDKELRSLPVFNRALKADRVVVQSFNHQWLRVYKDLAPDVTVGLLYGGRPTADDIAAAATWAEQVNPALGAIDESTVDQIHASGMEAHVWTVNAGQDMRRAINWEVDGIITNYPQVLRDILRRG
ncbi:glycerophosphodiester phosphodiesterase family protein [Nocardioides sp. STR2]|uniref:Glycerophosphodiester phosphodiesterase family protein n=1 Tax=Nocardioides pini TaxID=2975053 RepID=A0ABT4CC63_9ACTN|nr:glycerophosphodiester phosphodiesterase family protein [Nocardioides pini]MCY4725487.1 glycerophosphodiester phosphodiesterase family protein [Nocardioides pini]